MTPADDPARARDTARVSIVIPAYNRERYIGDALDGVLAQTMPRWEAVVFDDGSTDGTAAAAQRYADRDTRIRVVGGPNGGVAAARNRGWAATGGGSEFLIFLDSDDVWETDSLQVLVDALDAHPDLVSAYGLARCTDLNGQLVADDDLEENMQHRVAFDGGRLEPVDAEEPTTFAGLVHLNWTFTPGIHLMRRSIADRVGTFDPQTDPADDWDFVIRLSRHGDIAFVRHRVLRWRRHADTLSETSPRWRRAHYRVRHKTLIDPDNTPEQSRLAGTAFRHDIHLALGEAGHRLRSRDLRGAIRPAGQAVDRYARYFRAKLAARIGRRRR